MKTKSGIRSKQGFAFATTLVIMVAVFILGIAILAMTNTEAVHTAVQYNRTQAYYAARSGVEVAIRKLQATIAAGEYDTVESLYNVMSTAGVVSGSVVPGRDTYSAQFMDDGLLAEDRMKIYSVGTQEDMSATTALTLYFDTPNYMPLDWLNPGQIIKAGFWERSTGAVVVRTAKILGHSPKKSTVADTTWRAPAIHFVDDDNGFCLEVTAKALKLQTNLLSFKHMVFFDKNNTKVTLLNNNSIIVNVGFLEGPMANPLDGEVPIGTLVELTAPTGTTIYYTNNGEDPTVANWITYDPVARIPINTSQRIKAIAVLPDGRSSYVAIYDYTVIVARPSVGSISMTPNSPRVGNTMRIVYTFKHDDITIKQGESIVEWFRDSETTPFLTQHNDPSLSENFFTYTTSSIDKNRFIHVKVTPIDKNGVVGNPVENEPLKVKP